MLVVDDDQDVHAATDFALADTRLLGRPIELLHAHSAQQARTLLAHDRDLAVILLDVVMETPDAGLGLVQHIRHDLGMTTTRIVLHTGQPGHEPEHETLQRYDINDYQSKGEVTRHRLLTTLTTALRSYEQIRTIEASRRGLQHIVEGSAALLEAGELRRLADGALAQLARLLNTAPDGLVCAQSTDATTEPTVLARAGRYASQTGQPVEPCHDHPAMDRLRAALSQRRSIFGPDDMVLFIPGDGAGLDLAAYLHTGRPLETVTKQLIDVFCVNLRACLRNLELIERLRHLAYEDGLLRIPNRTQLIERIDDDTHDARQPRRLALIDIDDFSGINELMGHEFGDRVLQSAAQRLRTLLPSDVLLARVAGNAFAVYGPRGALDPANLSAALTAPLDVDGQPFRVRVSIGSCDDELFEGRGVNAVRNAQVALKHAKQQHRGRWVAFDRDMAVRSRHRAELLTRLNAAFNENQLFVVYQPQIELASGRLIGMEALVRWRRNDGQLIPPDTFIPVAERSGLIDALGDWVLQTACHDLLRLLRLGFDPGRVAVNVSVIQFGGAAFADRVLSTLERLGLPSQRLELEITESVAMLGEDVVQSVLQRLRAAGLSVAIDDFGTGYSSLAYLERLPLDCLKIDRVFVRRLEQGGEARVAELIAQLGHKLGLRVLAEGIEDETVRQRLLALGCQEGQGFGIARPMAFEPLRAWLEARACGALPGTNP
ncbi:MAG: EAL domain-containing protein [Tepidimonas sp.]|uniref:GGDEF/EAL domain-containing response regulator n=1 Tax=Tepidimonas sp. TaxID=2002775 RepID=UPI00259E248D|nr:EAL domain-containing protein [Tepidimonas sp.]MDM7456835.1 EAL domain-containing protein [Tepidimonas sp.]